MKKKILSAAAIAGMFTIVLSAVALFAVSKTRAEDAPSKAVLRIVNHIHANQEIINQTRDAHIQFMSAKDANIFDVGQLRTLCYDFDWSAMTAKKIEGCATSELFQ